MERLDVKDQESTYTETDLRGNLLESVVRENTANEKWIWEWDFSIIKAQSSANSQGAIA